MLDPDMIFFDKLSHVQVCPHPQHTPPVRFCDLTIPPLPMGAIRVRRKCARSTISPQTSSAWGTRTGPVFLC